MNSFLFSPIQDLKSILEPMGVKFFDKTLSYSCGLTKTCNTHLRVLKRKHGMKFPEAIASQFYDFYKDQIEMNLVDAFVCFHPVSMCELYMRFNRSMIIISSTRYELARHNPDDWNRLNENLKLIAKDPKNVIGANNLYDAQYIRYFTGIDVQVLPSFCNYTNVNYNPKRKEFILASTHLKSFDLFFRKSLQASIKQHGNHELKVVPLRLLYRKYKFSDLAKHPAIVHVPYQVSIMSLFEQYRMNIPLFFPSLDLLTKWHYEYGVVNERTWLQTLTETRPTGSAIKGVFPNIPDPNNDMDISAIRYWLNFADFYQWPHITYYDSTDDLVKKLTTTDFQAISKKMQEYNQKLRDNLSQQWRTILKNIKQSSRKFNTLKV